MQSINHAMHGQLIYIFELNCAIKFQSILILLAIIVIKYLFFNIFLKINIEKLTELLCMVYY